MALMPFSPTPKHSQIPLAQQNQVAVLKISTPPCNDVKDSIWVDVLIENMQDRSCPYISTVGGKFWYCIFRYCVVPKLYVDVPGVQAKHAEAPATVSNINAAPANPVISLACASTHMQGHRWHYLTCSNLQCSPLNVT